MLVTTHRKSLHPCHLCSAIIAYIVFTKYDSVPEHIDNTPVHRNTNLERCLLLRCVLPCLPLGLKPVL